MNKHLVSNKLVLQNIADRWAGRLPTLSNYLLATFRYSGPSKFQTMRLFIAKTTDGDIGSGNIGSVFSNKWVVSGGDIEAVPLDYDYDKMYETDESGDTYKSPSFLFFIQDCDVLLSERYGPSLKHRLRGKIVNDQTIEWVTLWCDSAD